MRAAIISILFAIALALSFAGCESTKAISTPPSHGVFITLNGKDIFIHRDAKIVTRDPLTGRFITPRVVNP